MSDQIVPPSGKGLESLYLLIITVSIISVCAVLISFSSRDGDERSLQEHELDAFTALNAKELMVFNNLRTSALEIDAVHQESGDQAPWPTVSQLQDDALPPFLPDTSWKKSGQYQWQRILRPSGNIDVAVFVGHPNKDSGCGTMLLLFLHNHGKKQGNAGGKLQHAPYEIWYHGFFDEPAPEFLTDQAFIAAGWKEIKALSGADEMQRIKGK